MSGNSNVNDFIKNHPDVEIGNYIEYFIVRDKLMFSSHLTESVSGPRSVYYRGYQTKYDLVDNIIHTISDSIEDVQKSFRIIDMYIESEIFREIHNLDFEPARKK